MCSLVGGGEIVKCVDAKNPQHCLMGILALLSRTSVGQRKEHLWTGVMIACMIRQYAILFSSIVIRYISFAVLQLLADLFGDRLVDRRVHACVSSKQGVLGLHKGSSLKFLAF